MMTKPLAIFVSDIHLSQKPPALRSDEPDWFAAMRRPLREVCQLAKKLDCPVICAGDIFDHWKAPPELINFALQELPEMYAIPGQHDLPNHDYEDIERSAYWTLVEAGVVKDLEPHGVTKTGHNLLLLGFPWGFPVHSFQVDRDMSGWTKIAVIHQYCWTGRYKYPTAPQENELSHYKLSGYDAAVFADNHIGFIKGTICNTGGFQRRTSLDMDRKPFVGVLMSDLTIKKHLLDTSDDVYSLDAEDEVKIVQPNELLKEFTDELLGLKGGDDLDFGQVLKRKMKQDKTKSPVRKIIVEAVDKEQVR